MWEVKCGETLFELFVFVANGNAWMDGLQKIHVVKISCERGFCQEGGTLGLLVYFGNLNVSGNIFLHLK